MGLFYPYISREVPQTGLVLGQTVQFKLPRDFPRESFKLRVSVTVSTPAATLAPEGIFALIKRIRLSANDGGSVRDILNADSLSITQRTLHHSGGALDSQTKAAVTAAFSPAATYVFNIFHAYAPLSLASPTRDLFLQNFPRFNNDPVLEIQVGSQADIDKNATPTFAISALSITVTELKRVVTKANWRFLNTEFATFEQFYPATGPNQTYNIPIPGYHFAVGMRPYTSLTALGDVSIVSPPGIFHIKALNVTERDFELQDCKTENQLAGARADSDLIAPLNSSYWVDWLNDQVGDSIVNLDTLLDSNVFVGIGVTPQVIGDIVGGTGVKIVYMHDRCYGNISAALALFQKAA